MIERYTRPEMGQIWEPRNRYLKWLIIELAVCKEMAAKKMISAADWRVLNKKSQALIQAGGVDPKRVDHFEKTTRHDVIAFTTAVAERVGPTARYIHFGLTSSDILDTGLAMQSVEAGCLVIEGYKKLIQSLRRSANKYKSLPTIGRSHGIFAEPTSFGLKFLGWATEGERNLTRLKNAVDGIGYGQLSGAVGVNAHWSPAFEKKVLRSIGLKREPVSTQVIPRDRHADLISVLALIGAHIERISVELRHLQRSEVAEVMEGFAKGQKGSSAMPHKRNPISGENLTGQARLLRSHAQAALENIALWHERDISHSSVERVIFPDALILADYAIHRTIRLIDGLVVRKENVLRNLKSAGSTVYSGHVLLELVQSGASREESYYWIQECAHGDLEGKGDFIDLLCEHPKVLKYLKPKEIRKLGSIDYQLRHVDQIFRAAK